MSEPDASTSVLSPPAPYDKLPPGELLVRTFNEVREDLVRLLLFVLGNREDAQDTAQEAFLKCWRAQGSLARVRNLRAWILRVGLNSARDLRRSGWHCRARQLEGEVIMALSNEASPPQALEAKDALRRLREAILQLPRDEKQVLLLRQSGELTYEQIAEIRHSPVGTVKTQMRRALHKLRQALRCRREPST